MHPDFIRALAADRYARLRRAAGCSQIVAGRGPGRRQWPDRLRRLSRRIAAVITECLRAQRRATVLRASVDRHLPEPHLPPADYAEFLTRTAGPLLREPPAAARWRGQTVR